MNHNYARYCLRFLDLTKQLPLPGQLQNAECKMCKYIYLHIFPWECAHVCTWMHVCKDRDWSEVNVLLITLHSIFKIDSLAELGAHRCTENRHTHLLCPVWPLHSWCLLVPFPKVLGLQVYVPSLPAFPVLSEHLNLALHTLVADITISPAL